MKKMHKIIIISAAAAATIIGLVLWDAPRNRIELVFERAAIEQAVQDYFAAEMAGDKKKVYACLAPSSTYRQSHTYDEYLDDVSDSPVNIRSYHIVDIYRLRGNHDPGTYPAVKRFVQVEVDVEVGFDDTGTQSTCNYCFTFLKEGGAWYKG